ncbi:hypothetical protein ACKVEX_12660 [Rhodocyclaceae bacterium SMB388]
MSSRSHITTRRGFIAAMGFGGVGLYGLWAAYGAAPGPLTLLGLGDHGGHAQGVGGGGHGGHAAGAHDGPSAEAFSRMTAEFIERYRLPDGTVYPRMLPSAPALVEQGDHGAMDHGAMAGSGVHADAAPTMSVAVGPVSGDHADHDDHDAVADDSSAGGVREVLLAAGKWYYQPHALRLDAGQAYRFRMMAVDVSHGASIQFGHGGRVVRLRPGRLTEIDVTFHTPGRYLVYCTVYCGPAHDYMQATIEVV